jgi:2'-5' RNA ligase
VTPSRVASGGVFVSPDGPMIRDGTFVVTLTIDEPSFTRLDELRKRYLPRDVIQLPAHLTLFHALTDDQVSRLPDVLPILTDAIPLRFVRPTLIGRGVAIEVSSSELSILQIRIIEALGHGLTRQDRRPFRPHVTIQNKVAREAARTTFAALAYDFSPWSGGGIGMDTWRYLGGSWAPHSHILLT